MHEAMYAALCGAHTESDNSARKYARRTSLNASGCASDCTSTHSGQETCNRGTAKCMSRCAPSGARKGMTCGVR